MLVYCSDDKCGHWKRLGRAECGQWPDDVRLSDLKPKFVCEACGKRGADIRPDFDWEAAEELNRSEQRRAPIFFALVAKITEEFLFQRFTPVAMRNADNRRHVNLIAGGLQFPVWVQRPEHSYWLGALRSGSQNRW